MERLRLLLASLLSVAAAQAAAQEPGWHYSPLPGEGDRAALGCAGGSDASVYACIAVRCEDDGSVGLHIHTSRTDGDGGKWAVQVDGDSHVITAEAGTSPYGGKIAGDAAPLIDALKHGAIAYLEAEDGKPLERNGISLSGSLYAINQALYFCVPPAEEPPVT